MSNFRNLYRCQKCGNIAEIIHAGDRTPSCCGEHMTLLEPHEGQEGKEKHIPIVTTTDSLVSVVVGSIEHPMLAEHYIEWIELETPKSCQRVFLKPGDQPKATFAITSDTEQLVRVYCNIHGLWQTSV